MDNKQIDMLDYVYNKKAKRHMITEFIKNFKYIDFMETYNYMPFNSAELNREIQTALRDFMLALGDIQMKSILLSK